MKTIKSLFLLIFIANTGIAQDHPLSALNFNEGKWEMYITIGEGTPKEIKKLKNLYTNDVIQIKNIIIPLITSRDTNSSGFSHYTQDITLIQNGKEVVSIGLYSTLGKINIDDYYFNYNASEFEKKTRKLKAIPHADFTVSNKETAFKLQKYLLNKEKIMYYPNRDTLWFSFEGKLNFKAEFKSINIVKTDSLAYKREVLIKMAILEGKSYIDIPDSLDSPASDDDLNYYDSLSTARENIIKNNIE